MKIVTPCFNQPIAFLVDPYIVMDIMHMVHYIIICTYLQCMIHTLTYFYLTYSPLNELRPDDSCCRESFMEILNEIKD